MWEHEVPLFGGGDTWWVVCSGGNVKSASVANRHEEPTCAWLDDDCITTVSFLSLVLLCSFWRLWCVQACWDSINAVEKFSLMTEMIYWCNKSFRNSRTISCCGYISWCYTRTHVHMRAHTSPSPPLQKLTASPLFWCKKDSPPWFYCSCKKPTTPMN